MNKEFLFKLKGGGFAVGVYDPSDQAYYDMDGNLLNVTEWYQLPTKKGFSTSIPPTSSEAKVELKKEGNGVTVQVSSHKIQTEVFFEADFVKQRIKELVSRSGHTLSLDNAISSVCSELIEKTSSVHKEKLVNNSAGVVSDTSLASFYKLMGPIQ